MRKKVRKDKSKRVVLSGHVRSIAKGQSTEKLSDPGSFFLDCSIYTSRFNHSLWDLGSSINLIPKSVVEKLGMTNYTPTRITLLFTDRSKQALEGILEDALMKIGNCLIPADFVVQAYDVEPKDPFILGRAFLATASGKIDVKKGRISFNICNVEMKFGMDGSEFTLPINSIATNKDTPPKDAPPSPPKPTTEVLTAQRAVESCRESVSIYTTPPVDRHIRPS